MAVLATRHILRAMYGLAVVYTSRWTFNYKDKIGEDAIEVNTTKVSVTIFINSPLHSVKNIVAGVTFQFWAIFDRETILISLDGPSSQFFVHSTFVLFYVISI